MALTYIETVRLLMGDLDEGDNNFFTADQWAHLFGVWSYDNPDGDSKVSIVEVAQAALAILAVYHSSNGDKEPRPTSSPTGETSWAAGTTASRLLYIVDGVPDGIGTADAFRGPMGLPGDDSTVPGPPGADSTVPGPPGADSTVPGPRGPSGAGGSTLLETSVPANNVGVDGNTALVRISDIALRGYLKAGGVWDRVFTFHGGDTVFLADSPAIADRIPAQDPAGTFSRYIGLSGYSPVTDADITMAQRPIASVADFRGGFFGTSWASSNDTLPFQSVHANLESAAGNLQIAAAVPFYLWFGLPLSVNGLDIVSVSYNSVDIPITKQANAARGGGEVQIWVSDATYMWAEIKDHPFVLTIEKDASAPNTYNRYAVVTANPESHSGGFPLC